VTLDQLVVFQYVLDGGDLLTSVTEKQFQKHDDRPTGMEPLTAPETPKQGGEPFQKIKAYEKTLADADEEMAKWLEQTYRARLEVTKLGKG
jgi:hypothetical protein